MLLDALGNKGADLLVEHGIPRSAANWTAKNRAIGERFVHHTLLVSGIMVAFVTQASEHQARVMPFTEV